MVQAFRFKCEMKMYTYLHTQKAKARSEIRVIVEYEFAVSNVCLFVGFFFVSLKHDRHIYILHWKVLRYAFLVNNLLHSCQTTTLNWGDISIRPKRSRVFFSQTVHSRRQQLASSNMKICVWSSIYHYCLDLLASSRNLSLCTQ